MLWLVAFAEYRRVIERARKRDPRVDPFLTIHALHNFLDVQRALPGDDPLRASDDELRDFLDYQVGG